MKTVAKDVIIGAPVHKVWNAFTQSNHVAKWSGKPADIRPREGYEFMFFGGDVRGRIELAVPHTELVATIRCMSDIVGIVVDGDTKVTLSFRPAGEDRSKTALSVRHTNIPKDFWHETAAAWDLRIIEPLKRHLEIKNDQTSTSV